MLWRTILGFQISGEHLVWKVRSNTYICGTHRAMWCLLKTLISICGNLELLDVSPQNLRISIFLGINYFWTLGKIVEYLGILPNAKCSFGWQSWTSVGQLTDYLREGYHTLRVLSFVRSGRRISTTHPHNLCFCLTILALSSCAFRVEQDNTRPRW